MTKTKSKAKGAANRTKRSAGSQQRIVGLLVKAAEAQDDVAAAYREMKWDLAAEKAEDEAREFRRRADAFKEAKQSNEKGQR